MKSKLTPSLGRRVRAKGRRSLGKIQQKMSGLSPVTTSSDKGRGQSSSPVPRPDPITSQATAPSKVVPCRMATPTLWPRTCPNPLCSGVWDGGVTSLPVSILGRRQASAKFTFHIHPENYPTCRKNLLLFSLWLRISAQHGGWQARTQPSTQLLPSCGGATTSVAPELVAHFSVAGLSRCTMLHVAARPGALANV